MEGSKQSISRIDLLLVVVLFFVSLFISSNQLVDATLASRFLGALSVLTIGLLFKARHVSAYLKEHISWLDIILISFCTWQILSISWATNTAQAFGAGFRFVALLLSYLLLRVLIVSDARWKSYLPFIISVFSSIYLLTVWGKMLLISKDFGLNANSVYMLRYPSETKNLISLFLLVSAPFHVQTIIENHNWKRWFGITNVVVTLATLFLLSTRGISIAIAGIGGALFLSQTAWKKHRFKYGIHIALGVILLGAGHWFSSNLMKKTNLESYKTKTSKPIEESQEPSSEQNYRSANERLALWKKTLGIIKQDPILGVGTGNWQIAYPRNGLDGLERAEYRVTSFKRPHNLILSITSELGLIGLILFAVVVIQFFLNIYRGEKNQLIVGCAMAGFLVASMFDFPLERMEHNLLFSAILALTASPQKNIILSMNQAKLAFASLIIVGIVGITVQGFRFHGESNYGLMRTLKSQNKYERCIETSYQVENLFYTVDWINYPFAWYRGVCYTYLGKFQEGEKEFERAVELNPGNFHSHNNLGFTIAQQERFEEAIPFFEKSLEINSKFEDARFNLAYSLIMLKKPHQALDVMSIHIQDTAKLNIYRAEANKLLAD